MSDTARRFAEDGTYEVGVTCENCWQFSRLKIKRGRLVPNDYVCVHCGCQVRTTRTPLRDQKEPTA